MTISLENINGLKYANKTILYILKNKKLENEKFQVKLHCVIPRAALEKQRSENNFSWIKYSSNLKQDERHSI